MDKALSELCAAFGLSQREQVVFESLLHRGNQPASRIAKSVSLARNTTRNILDRLVDHGLVVRAKRSNSHIYRVESLDALQRNLRELLARNEFRIKRQLETVSLLKPLLDKTNQPSKRPMVQFYEGLDGAERVYEDTLSSPETIRAWASFDANSQSLPEYFQTYYRRRASRGIRVRSIHPDTPLARRHAKRNRAERRDCVLLPEFQFTLRPEIQVYGDRINIVSWEAPFGILIESTELAEGLKSIFDLNYSLAQEKIRALKTRKKR